jgi:hypothetical protein
MSKKRVCPWRCEAYISAGGVYNKNTWAIDDIWIQCFESDCAKWGLIERGAMTLIGSVYEPAPDIYGCTRS